VNRELQESPDSKLKPTAAAVIAATTPAGEIVDEAAAKYQEWQKATYLLIGVMLKQLGRRAVEIKPAEIQKFAKANNVSFQQTAEGHLRYTVEKKK